VRFAFFLGADYLPHAFAIPSVNGLEGFQPLKMVKNDYAFQYGALIPFSQDKNSMKCISKASINIFLALA
jgi:hypothetical protein